MGEVLRFALLGLGIGSLYALASQGLVAIYRGSGVLNFAQGAIGMVGAFIAWELQYKHGLDYAEAATAGVLCSALLGLATQVLLMRRLVRAAPLVRIVATLGVLVFLQAAATVRYSTAVTLVPSALPTTPITLFGNVTISADRLILFGIAAVVSVALSIIYKRTMFGLATAAVAENQRASAALGWSPGLIAAANWTLGSALAGIAAILISPIVELQVSTMTNLVLAAMAAALIASFRSFPIAFAAGIVIGVLQSELQRYVTTPGIPTSVPFGIIIVWMIFKGQALPLRDFLLQRLPVAGAGRVRPLPILFGLAVVVVMVQLLSAVWIVALTTSLGVGLILLSIVVLTGYAGQISLAQYTIAGLGAFIAGRLAATGHVPFLAALVIGVVAMVPVGMLFALPAVRTRGVNLAIVTLGLGSAIELVVFNNPGWTGGELGTQVPVPSLFGFSLDPIVYAQRYAYFAAVMFALFALAIAGLRRGRSGRRMLAVRTNERAAAALGISVRSVKLYAFGLASAIAAAGGIVLAYQNPIIMYDQFTNYTSVTDVAWTVLGGVGYLMGPIVGAEFTPGSLGNAFFNHIGGGLGSYLQLIGGAMLLLVVVRNQNGIVHEQVRQVAHVRRLVRTRLLHRPAVAAAHETVIGEGDVARVAPRVLSARDVTVRFGGVVAVNGVSLEVRPGQITGLIGPNGAGKTTMIDAITGFTRPASGSVTLDGADIGRLGATGRCRLGISRSFQSLELFEDMTVLDNLRTACDPRDNWSYLRDLVRPVNPPLPSEVVAAIRQFGLHRVLDSRVEDLPYGRRRLVAIARALATRPSILLLDEPAAGLGSAESADLARVVRRLPDEWGIGVLLVEHDIDFVTSVCDHIVVLDFGRKIAEGTAEQVMRDDAVIAAYLGVDVPDEGADLAVDGMNAASIEEAGAAIEVAGSEGADG